MSSVDFFFCDDGNATAGKDEVMKIRAFLGLRKMKIRTETCSRRYIYVKTCVLGRWCEQARARAALRAAAWKYQTSTTETRKKSARQGQRYMTTGAFANVSRPRPPLSLAKSHLRVREALVEARQHFYGVLAAVEIGHHQKYAALRWGNLTTDT